VFVPGVSQGSFPTAKCTDLDEERRLLYVAITRAQGLVYLSYHTTPVYGENPNELSPFLSTPKIKQMVHERGQHIDADALASVLKRTPPTKEQIACSSANLYRLFFAILIDRPSLRDDDIKENEEGFKRVPSSSGGFNRGNTGIGMRTPSSSQGSSSSQSSYTAPPASNIVPSTNSAPIGFMSSRQVFANLPAVQASSQNNILKRKGEESLDPATVFKFPKIAQQIVTENAFVSPEDLFPAAELKSLSKAVSSITGAAAQPSSAPAACDTKAKGYQPAKAPVRNQTRARVTQRKF
jgi:hypothetical protein